MESLWARGRNIAQLTWCCSKLRNIPTTARNILISRTPAKHTNIETCLGANPSSSRVCCYCCRVHFFGVLKLESIAVAY